MVSSKRMKELKELASLIGKAELIIIENNDKEEVIKAKELIASQMDSNCCFKSLEEMMILDELIMNFISSKK